MLIAHAGHWLVNIMYAMPVLVVAGAIVVSVVRERRRDPDADGTAPSADARRAQEELVSEQPEE